MNTYKLKRTIVLIRNLLRRGGYKRARFLKKINYFKEFGDNNYWYPRNLPADPQCVIIHNNVKVASDVYFCTHDVIHHMLNDCPEYKAMIDGRFKYRKGTIEIKDNVFIGAKAILMYDTTIGPNAIVAAGSVVTKDVQPNTVVGGNPARVICTMDEYISKRLEFENIKK